MRLNKATFRSAMIIMFVAKLRFFINCYFDQCCSELPRPSGDSHLMRCGQLHLLDISVTPIRKYIL